jgi:hypothetical protein
MKKITLTTASCLLSIIACNALAHKPIAGNVNVERHQAYSVASTVKLSNNHSVITIGIQLSQSQQSPTVSSFSPQITQIMPGIGVESIPSIPHNGNTVYELTTLISDKIQYFIANAKRYLSTIWQPRDHSITTQAETSQDKKEIKR